jgi:glutathione synthase
MVNHPKAIRNCSEKLSALNFPHLIPPTLITSDAHVANEFLTAYHNAVIKPLFGFGGMDVMRIKAGDDPQEGAEIIKRYISEFKTCILQKYIPTIISEGDKRVFIVDGKILGGIRRMPAKGNFLAGVASGGTGSQLHKLSGSDISIAQEVALWLDGAGIFMAGIDIIGDNLIEINVTSPTGFKLRNTLNPELQPIEQEIIDLIQDRI